MKVIKDDYVTHLVIEKSEVKEIRFLKDKKMRLSEWYAKYKPDCLINGALFNPDGTPIENYISDYKVYSQSNWAVDGVSVMDNVIEFGKPKGRDFISGFPCLIPKININVSVSGANPRSVFSINDGEILLTTVDGRQNGRGMTITQLANYMQMMGVTHSINLDGGGSTRMVYKGEVLNKPTEDRAVSNVIAIWLKDGIKDGINGGDKVKICLDYGHNNSGFDTGASYYGYKEQDLTFNIGKLVKAELEKYVDIIETRPNKLENIGYNLNSSLNKRAEISNKAKADYFISIHCNANTNTTAYGTETYVISKGGQAEKLAEQVNNSLSKEVGTYNRGVKAQNLAVLRETDCPAILIECAFLSNKNDCNILVNRQEDIAKGIVKGVLKHLGIEYKTDKNKYSYDNTVEKMIIKGYATTGNMALWEKLLVGNDELRNVLDKEV